MKSALAETGYLSRYAWLMTGSPHISSWQRCEVSSTQTYIYDGAMILLLLKQLYDCWAGAFEIKSAWSAWCCKQQEMPSFPYYKSKRAQPKGFSPGKLYWLNKRFITKEAT